jgi:hypothetical protein
MTSSPIRILVIALAILAVAAPAAGASPLREGSPATSHPHVQRHQLPAAASAPAPRPHVTPIATDSGSGSGTSPLVYILPVLVLGSMLAATVTLVRPPVRA